VEEHRLTLDGSLAILERRKWQAIISASILFAIAVLVSLLIPPSYSSTAVMLIERLEIPPDPARTKVMRHAEQRLRVIGRRVMTASHLSTLIERYDLYSDIRRRESLDMAVAEMRKRITLDAISAEILDMRTGHAWPANVTWALSFEDGSAKIAREVTNALASLFLSESLKHRTTANPAADSLHTAAERLAAEIDTLKTRLATVERQRVDQHTINELRRDYGNAMARYRELREQSLQAELVRSLERDRQGERFSLLKPPVAPEKPDTPNRLAILVLGFVLAGAGSVGHLLLLECLDTGLHGPRAIQLATPIPLLAVVPHIETARDRQTRLKRTYALAGVALTLVLVATTVIHWLVIPLDLLWSLLMRRVDAAAPGLLG
jgi:LPS O-antigen subunit length determinant protein (WzzB/FepE family)